MKKILLGLSIVLAFLLLAVYIFIPGKLKISSTAVFTANREAVYRFLINDSSWQKWWPGTVQHNDKSPVLKYKEFDFQIEKIEYDAIQLTLTDKNKIAAGTLKVIPYSIDSIGILLSTELISGQNPLSRVSTYLQAKKIKHSLDDIVSALKNYCSAIKNIYGVDIRKEKVEYDRLLSTTVILNHYPSTKEIYEVISSLRIYLVKKGAKELFYPMLNIEKGEGVNYIIKVGIPIDKKIDDDGNMSAKWMMKGGNILTGEVVGGNEQINKAALEFEKYIIDHQRSTIAIPFQMLVTDRTKEPDSTKWVTRLYYPVV